MRRGEHRSTAADQDRGAGPARLSALLAAAGLVLLLLAPASAGPEPAPDPAMVKRVRDVLHTLVTPPCTAPSAVEDELHSMGEAVLPVLQSLHHGFDAPVQVAVLARVRTRLSDRSTSSWLAELAATSDTVTTRTTAYRCLSELGTREGLVGLLDARVEESLSVRRCADRALVAVLRRSDSPECYEIVRSRLTAGDGALRRNVLQSVARANSVHGLRILCEAFSDDREQNLLLLSAIAGMSVPPRNDIPAKLIRPFLESEDPELREGAILALAGFLDEGSAEAFVALLDADPRGVASAAHAALRRLSLAELPADPVRWQAWLMVERAWWKDQGRGFVKAMWGNDREQILNAIRGSARHPLYRGHFEERLQVLTGAPDGEIRAEAKSARIRLGVVQPAPDTGKEEPAPRSGPGAANPDRGPAAGDPAGPAKSNTIFYLLLLGIPVCLLLLLKVSNISPLERLRARRANVPIILRLNRERAPPEKERKVAPPLTPEELFYRNARKIQGR